MICMAEVRLTMEEYQALLAASREFEGTGRLPSPSAVKRLKPKPKRKGTPDPKLSRALKKANEWGRLKSGKLRKGVSQGDIMSKAHKLRRKMK